MISLTSHSKVYIFSEAVNFKNGIDGLVRLCENQIHADPYSGQFFVFINKSKISVKILVYDGQGFWLMQKRLSRGTFKYWPKTHCEFQGMAAQVLLNNGDCDKLDMQSVWKKINNYKQ